MNKIVILGHGVGVKFVIDTLLLKKELNTRVVAVVTHPIKDHERDLEMMQKNKDLYGKFAYNIFHVPNEYNISLLQSEDVNNIETQNWIEKFNPSYIISIGCRNIIKSPFLEKFKGKVFNIHTTPLPRYRGAAGDTWMILHNEWGEKLYGCIHEINTGIDTGRILVKQEFEVPKKCYPIELFKVRMSIFPKLIEKFLIVLETSEHPQYIEQDQDQGTTYPRLYTPVDGRINFNNMDGYELERFIFAFSYPFEGAHCFLDDTKININEAEFVPGTYFHPFGYGIIIGKNEKKEYKIAVRGGYLLIKKITINGEQQLQNSILRLGKRLN